MNTDIPPDIRPARRRSAQLPARTSRTLRGASLSGCYRETAQGTRESHIYAGAVCAARWTQGHTAEAPMTGKLSLYSGSTFLDEIAVADPVVWGQRSDLNRDYARGVSAWLWWLAGTQPRPRWLR